MVCFFALIPGCCFCYFPFWGEGGGSFVKRSCFPYFSNIKERVTDRHEIKEINAVSRYCH